jgi:hypothetical protein
MKLVSSLFAAAAVICAGVVTLNPAVAQQDPPAAQKQKAGASVARPNETGQRTFVPENFRLKTDGETESAVDSLTVKQSVVTDEIGAERAYETTPARPPEVTYTWGDRRPTFPGVVEGLNTKYTLFSPDGAPARATTNVDVSEAEKAKQKQRTPDEEDDEDDE